MMNQALFYGGYDATLSLLETFIAGFTFASGMPTISRAG
jgi:hypothetical protein